MDTDLFIFGNCKKKNLLFDKRCVVLFWVCLLIIGFLTHFLSSAGKDWLYEGGYT